MSCSSPKPPPKVPFISFQDQHDSLAMLWSEYHKKLNSRLDDIHSLRETLHEIAKKMAAIREAHPEIKTPFEL